MTQEDKQLLLKDLCARVPYGVKVFISGIEFDNYQYYYTLTAISKFGQDSLCKVYSPIYTPLGAPDIEYVVPYLRPMSSMTEEELKELKSILNYDGTCDCFLIALKAGKIIDINFALLVDWLNKKMFDYRGLIPKGLALKAPEGMYKIKGEQQ